MRTNTKLTAVLCIACLTSAVVAQTPAKPVAAAPKPAAVAAKPVAPAAAKPNAQVEYVIDLLKNSMGEDFIVKDLQKTNKAANLTPAEMGRLKKAGASDRIIEVMRDPQAGGAAVAAAVVTPPPAVPAVTAAVVVNNPAPAPAPEAAPQNTAAMTAAVAIPEAAAAPTHAQKKRVMVNSFDFSAPETAEMKVFGTNQNIGKGIRAMFITRAQQGGKIVVVERGEKEKQLEAEQDKGIGSRQAQASGARIGRIQGADAILAGDVTIFGNDNKRTNVAGTGTVAATLRIMKRKDDTDKAVVAIEYRLIDAETSEVIASGTARGEAERKGKKTGGWSTFGQVMTGTDISTSSSGFEKTIIGEATQDCVNKLAIIMNEQTAVMKKRVREVETSIVDVSNGSLTIGAGQNDGVKRHHRPQFYCFRAPPSNFRPSCYPERD